MVWYFQIVYEIIAIDERAREFRIWDEFQREIDKSVHQMKREKSVEISFSVGARDSICNDISIKMPAMPQKQRYLRTASAAPSEREHIQQHTLHSK